MKKATRNKDFRFSSVSVGEIKRYAQRLIAVAERAKLVRRHNDAIHVCHELEMECVEINDRLRQIWNEYYEFEQHFSEFDRETGIKKVCS